MAAAQDTGTVLVAAEAEQGCVIGGERVPEGGAHAAYACLVCDSVRDARDWSPRAEDSPCGETRCSGGVLTPEATCSAAGSCVRGLPERCEAGHCADALACATRCAPSDCPSGTYCAASGGCAPKRSRGSSCAHDQECVSGACVEGLCCSDACSGTCESCRVPGSWGSCTIVPAMTDPDGECGPYGYCDGVGACAGLERAWAFAPAFPADAALRDGGVARTTRDEVASDPTRPAIGCAVGRVSTRSGARGLSLLALFVTATVWGRRRVRRSALR